MTPATSVCVVIGVRNGERFLGEAIESVLAQSHRRLELRIYDTRSSDRSAEIARGYLDDARVSFTVGHRRLADGMAAYELSARAALLQPDVADYRAQLEKLLGRAGLAAPRWPLEAVAMAGERSRAMAARLRSAGLLASCCDAPGGLRPGRVALCAAGSEAVAEAEARGVPAFIIDPPDPFGSHTSATFG